VHVHSLCPATFMAWPCRLSAVRLGDHLDHGMAVAAHPEVLEHVYGRSGRHGKQPERHGEPLRVSNKLIHLTHHERLVVLGS